MDHRWRRLDKRPRGCLDQTDHKSTRLDRNSLGRFGQQDQQDHSKLDSKFSRHVGLNREISVDSQASVQDWDNNHRVNITLNKIIEKLNTSCFEFVTSSKDVRRLLCSLYLPLLFLFCFRDSSICFSKTVSKVFAKYFDFQLIV